MLYLPNLDIWGNIFDDLPPADLIHFGQINKAAGIAVANYSQLNFDLKRVLSPYFSEDDTQSFRQLQLTTGTVISGSTAVQLFDRTTYLESDLDVYAEHRYCRDVAWWLMSRGYRYKPSRPEQSDSFAKAFSMWSPDAWISTGYLGHGVTDIFDFFKAGSKRKVQLISTRNCTMEVILNFHSTCVMNVITHNMAYSLYPYATFQQRRSLVCGSGGTKREEARDKYRERGWRMEQHIDILEARDRRSDFKVGRRWVGDDRCWKIPLRPPLTSSPQAEGLIRDRITSNSWKMTHSLRRSRMTFLHPDASGLRFDYVCADAEVHEVFRFALQLADDDDDEMNEQLHLRIL